MMGSSSNAPTRVVPFSHAPGAQGSVKRGTGDLLIDNAPFGRTYHAAVVSSDGRFLYDLPALAEPSGAVALPIAPDGKVALMKHWRPLPAREPEADAMNFADAPALPMRGVWSLELPRGFPNADELPEKTAMREAQEELGVRVSRAAPLGFCNFNTSVLLSDIPLFAVLAHPNERTPDARDEAEYIERISWLSVDEAMRTIARGEIRCGLTLAALSHVVASKEKIDKLVNSEN